jgi:hypothetical protein
MNLLKKTSIMPSLIQRFYAKIDDGNSLVEFGEIVLHENALEVPL